MAHSAVVALLAVLVVSAHGVQGVYFSPGANISSLSDYLAPQTNLTASRGFWYNIVSWAARTHNCDSRPESVACMACSANLPAFAIQRGVAPLGVGNDMWFTPERGATCGMCLRVYMPAGNPNCTAAPDSNPACGGTGTVPYFPFVSEPWAYSANISWDADLQMFYFTGMVVEWFDRNQSLPTAITYPAQGNDTDSFGSWPVIYRGVPCPVGNHNITFQFLNVSTEIPLSLEGQDGWVKSAPSVGGIPANVTGSLCDNQLNSPCAKLAPASSDRPPLQYIKLQVAGSRVPIGGVALKLQGGWYTMHRSGDNYWQTDIGPPQVQDPALPVSIKVQCSDGANPVERVQQVLVPGLCMCKYQDPDCIPCESQIQC